MIGSGIDIGDINFELPDYKYLKLQVWFTTGWERFHTLTFSHINGGHLVLIVFNAHNKEEFLQCCNWVQQLYENEKKLVLISLQSQAKENTNENISDEEIQLLVKKYNLPYIAMTNSGSEEILLIKKTIMNILKPEVFSIEGKILSQYHYP